MNGAKFRRRLWLASTVLLPVVVWLILRAPLVATAVAAVLAIAGAALTVGHADSVARRQRTADYRARWDHPNFVEARTVASDFLNHVGVDEAAAWAAWQESLTAGTYTKERLQFVAVLNFWEEVASAFNQDFLDNDWFRSDLAYILDDNWQRAAWFIRRSRVDEEVFCEWQLAVKDFLDHLDERSKYRAGRPTYDADLLNVDQPRAQSARRGPSAWARRHWRLGLACGALATAATAAVAASPVPESSAQRVERLLAQRVHGAAITTCEPSMDQSSRFACQMVGQANQRTCDSDTRRNGLDLALATLGLAARTRCGDGDARVVGTLNITAVVSPDRTCVAYTVVGASMPPDGQAPAVVGRASQFTKLLRSTERRLAGHPRAKPGGTSPGKLASGGTSIRCGS